MCIQQWSGRLLLMIMFIGNSLPLKAQSSWFIDGYHGGFWGHYPPGYTGFIVEQLQRHPAWNINLEIEPVTWDVVKTYDSAAYVAMRSYILAGDRVEYVNPTYGQSYLFNISGESIIRQFSYGIKKLHQHFPAIRFRTYSSEEPCFTSALPQLLKSFGLSYASLKNPNTCFGGYTRPFGGELVKWTGPDGTWLYAVPRYASETLEKNSTWQTIGWVNQPVYINAARRQGIQHPIGMTLQDAGWKNGPWLGRANDSTHASVYTTWQHYFEQVADTGLNTIWKLNQEDIQVSLVWGAQVLQRIAQQVRHTEDKIVATEKLAAITALKYSYQWPQTAFDEAWQNLLLAQHHDCWIVPYNGVQGSTWFNRVSSWTTRAEHICDSIQLAALGLWATHAAGHASTAIRIFNTAACTRNECVTIPWNDNAAAGTVQSLYDGKQFFPVQWVTNDSTGKKEMISKVPVPSMGYSTFQLSNHKVAYSGAVVKQIANQYILETDHYRLVIDADKGGAIRSLVSKKLQNKEWIDTLAQFHFNEMTGNFFESQGRQHTAAGKAEITILENGPVRIKVKISGQLAGHPYQQVITLVQGEPRIDAMVRINWLHDEGIGSGNKRAGPASGDSHKKAFYDDRDKLLLLFPVHLDAAVVHKNAPFDVTASLLSNTFFTSWDSIKNNIVLHWVDVADRHEKYGMALFTDHTTAYVQGDGWPLGLVLQYAGAGLWGVHNSLNGPTLVHYSLLPHEGNWEKAGIEEQRAKLGAPLQMTWTDTAKALHRNSMITLNKKGWEITALNIDGHDLLVRVYHAAGADSTVDIHLQAGCTRAGSEALNGTTMVSLPVKVTGKNRVAVRVTAPRFGIRTIRFSGVRP